MDKLPEETIPQYFFRMLTEGKVDFFELVHAYVTYLERGKKKDRTQISESGFLLEVYLHPKTWQGTKKSLEEKTKKLIDDADIFDKKYDK